jgi:DNA-binding transcriptional LysR family regulator
MQDLNEMAIFAVVVGSGSFTKAAEKLKLPKSTVSRKVSQLEKRVGVRLINRTTRNLKPTETGKLYYESCVKMLEQAEEADNVVSNMQAEPTGVLRISTPLAFGIPFFVDMLHRFSKTYPKVKLEIISDNKTLDMLDEEIDIAFRIGPLEDSSLVARNLGTARLSLCATPEYLAKNGVPRTIYDLQEHSCIEHPDAPWTFMMKDGSEETVDVKPQMHANDMEMIRNLVLHGYGIGAVPQLLIADDVRSGNLRLLLQETPFSERTFYMVYPSRKEMPSKVVAFTEFILENCHNPPWEQLSDVFCVKSDRDVSDDAIAAMRENCLSLVK